MEVEGEKQGAEEGGEEIAKFRTGGTIEIYVFYFATLKKHWKTSGIVSIALVLQEDAVNSIRLLCI